MIQGGNVTSMLQMLPGGGHQWPDGPNRNFASGPGSTAAAATQLDCGWMECRTTPVTAGSARVSMDAVSSQVLLNNYQAEYGRMRGAGIQMVTKSARFHGSFYSSGTSSSTPTTFQ
jgi:hypothetical protein